MEYQLKTRSFQVSLGHFVSCRSAGLGQTGREIEKREYLYSLKVEVEGCAVTWGNRIYVSHVTAARNLVTTLISLLESGLRLDTNNEKVLFHFHECSLDRESRSFVSPVATLD